MNFRFISLTLFNQAKLRRLFKKTKLLIKIELGDKRNKGNRGRDGIPREKNINIDLTLKLRRDAIPMTIK